VPLTVDTYVRELGRVAEDVKRPEAGVVRRHRASQTPHTTMKTWIAILFTIGLLAMCLVISLLIGFDLTWIMVLGTAIWVAIDSSRLQLRRYKSDISYGPVVLFIACALLWIIGFPWYLSMRYKIKTGTAVLKEGVTNVAA
jgi:hypothetical protein